MPTTPMTAERGTTPRYRLSHDGLVFATRSKGAKLRKQIAERTGSSPAVLIDFDGVRSVSFSFADELFGVYVTEFLEGRAPSRPTAIGLAAQVQRVLLGSLERRGIAGAAQQEFVPH